MAEKEFNLLCEPWIRVMRDDCSIDEVSLMDALIHAHEYRGLAGELPTQDAAVLRVLLAVLHAVFERVNLYGENAEIDTADDALDRWEELWQNGKFPEEPLEMYLQTQQENFWLFHPTRPFWQVPGAIIGTRYEASKLNGCLSESSNKIRLFPERTGEEKKGLTFSEAARWLLYVNAYDDTAAKPTKAGKAENDGKMPSPGAGWLGKIGFISVQGDNLFETLMLNFVLCNENGEPWGSSIPAWELEIPHCKERTEIAVPQGQAELLTLQSRRIVLHKEGNCVKGFSLLGGDFFPKENAFVEQMTVWKPIKDKNNNCIGFQPRRHDKARQMWRDFASFIPMHLQVPVPGVIRWNTELQNAGCLDQERMLKLAISSVQYGDKDFFAADLFSDSLALHLNLLLEVGESYRLRILDMINRSDMISKYIGMFAADLFMAAGGDVEKKGVPIEKAAENFFFTIDIPFRNWLVSLDISDTFETREQKIADWCATADSIAFKLAEEMVQRSGKQAFIGRMVAIEKDVRRYYSASLAMRNFKYNMKKINQH